MGGLVWKRTPAGGETSAVGVQAPHQAAQHQRGQGAASTSGAAPAAAPTAAGHQRPPSAVPAGAAGHGQAAGAGPSRPNVPAVPGGPKFQGQPGALNPGARSFQPARGGPAGPSSGQAQQPQGPGPRQHVNNSSQAAAGTHAAPAVRQHEAGSQPPLKRQRLQEAEAAGGHGESSRGVRMRVPRCSKALA